MHLSDQQTHTSDVHARIALGTDELLLDIGYSHTRDILVEYRDRRIQLERLQNRLEVETDEDIRSLLQHQITTQQNILEDLTQEALTAGATQEQLNTINEDADDAAEENPFEQITSSDLADGSLVASNHRYS